MGKTTISKEQYLSAAKIVKEFHEQIRFNAQLKYTWLNDIGLKEGDYLTYLGGMKSQKFIKGERYKLTRDINRRRIFVRNDDGREHPTWQHYFSV
jgi:calcineurin-like phosphoesterase family protein